MDVVDVVHGNLINDRIGVKDPELDIHVKYKKILEEIQSNASSILSIIQLNNSDYYRRKLKLIDSSLSLNDVNTFEIKNYYPLTFEVSNVAKYCQNQSVEKGKYMKWIHVTIYKYFYLIY